MPDDWSWTPDETGLDDDDFPPLDFGLDDDTPLGLGLDDDGPCPWCGEDACERSCTEARRDDAGEDEA